MRIKYSFNGYQRLSILRFSEDTFFVGKRVGFPLYDVTLCVSDLTYHHFMSFTIYKTRLFDEIEKCTSIFF